jgi:hypothetical protein
MEQLQRDPPRTIHDGWIRHQRGQNKTTQSFACLHCLDRKIFPTSDELWNHATQAHRDKFPEDEKEMQGIRSKFEAEAALKRSATPLSQAPACHCVIVFCILVGLVGRCVDSLSQGYHLPCLLVHKALRLTQVIDRPIKEEPTRKPTYNEACSAGPEPPPVQKRPFSNPIQVAPSRSLSELKTLKIGEAQQESEDVPMKDISEDNQGEQPRKRAAIGDGISAGSASPLPFRDSESPPPRRSKARPTSAPYGPASETEMRRPVNFEDTQRPHVGKKILWTPDQDTPLTRSSFDPSNIASIQNQKSRNQAMQPKSRKATYQSPSQVMGASRYPNPQSHPNQPPSAIFDRTSNQNSQSQPKDEAFDIVLQPETRPISQEQLVAEVKGSKSFSEHSVSFLFYFV